MEKRLLLAIVLSILVLASFQYYAAKIAPQSEPGQIETRENKAGLSPQMTTGPTGHPDKQLTGGVSGETMLPGQEASFPVIEAGESKVETSLFKAAISLNGAGVAGWQLKEYKNKDGQLINLSCPERLASNLPLYIRWGSVSPLIFRGKELLKLGFEQPQGELFLQAQADPWRLDKKMAFSDQDYLFWLELSWQNLSSETRKLPDYYLVCTPGFGLQDKENRQYAEAKAGFVLGDTLKAKKWKIHSLTRKLIRRNAETGSITRLDNELPGIVRWLAYRVKYFTIIIKPEEEAKGILFSGLGEDEALCQLKMPGEEVRPGETFNQRFAVYLGPVDYDQLKRANLGLEAIFESGGLAPLRRLVMAVLKFFYKMVGNWGVAIILLTIVAKIILLPLTQKSFRSMGEMQKLQPQINSLRQVYKDNPQKLQKEIMELYRSHKVNPMGGCFPMLLQMPVFIALFTALRSAIELRHAPFIFWIKDLSAKDPLYVLPILMGGVMVAQQKMSPQADPQQAKMAMIMPIFFTFLFMNFPSGLVLYWLVNSFLSVGEQWWIKKKN